MAENIELRSYNVRNEASGGIQEYHEIKPGCKQIESLETESFVSKFSLETINDNDFFMHDGKHEPKEGNKKKKRKKKDKPSNIMDIISSEITSLTVPVTKNLIEVVEDRENYLNTYVQSFSREQRKYQRRKTILDSEFGYSRITRAQKLSPIYPNLLETFTDSAPNIVVEYVGPVSFNDAICEYDIHSQDKQPVKFLDIELKDIEFKHHHNYSLEDVLCIKLIDTYKEYEVLQETLKDLYHDIKVNRETKDNLKKDLIKVSPNKKDDIRFDATIRKYAGQLFKLKEQYIEGLKVKKELIHKIISLWSDIEMVREKLKSYDAPYNLNIDRQTLSKNEYEKAWNSLYEEEWTDKLAKIEYDYATKYIEYHEFKKEHAYELRSKKKISKPKLELDEDAIKEEVEEIVNNIALRDIINISLEKDEKYWNGMKFLRHIYHFEVYIDTVFVCESEQYTSMDKWHNVTFSEYFSVEILPKNENIRIVLMENEEYVAEVQANLINFKRSDDDSYIKLKFVYIKDVDPTPYFVGSGNNIKDIAAANKVRLKSSNTFSSNLKTTCEVNAKIRWNQNVDHTQSESIKRSLDIGKNIKRLMQGIDEPNVEVLSDVIHKIYGKDVTSDEATINTLKRLTKLEPMFNEEFLIDENTAEFARLKLLHLRNIGGFTDVENKMIPIHGSQISTEQLNCLQKTKEKDFDLDYLRDKEADMDPIELQRFIGAKFMQKLNKKMLKNLNEHLMVKTRKDVVCEFRNFNWRGIFSRGNNTNRLSLISNGAKQQILLESLSKEQEIQITVQRAFNLMDRTTELVDEEENNEELIAGYRMRPLRPFVRVSYRGLPAQTVAAIGCHPSWNHTLKLAAKLDPLTSLHIDIFDSCKVHIQEGSGDESTLSRTVHYRYFNKWLGTVQVPLFAVLSLGMLRGTFKINSPPVLFGYETVQNKGSQSLIPEVARLMRKQTSYIALHITTGLSHLGGFQDFTQPSPSSVEDDYIIKHLNNFVTDFVNDFPNRNIALTFIDSAGKNKCVTQFLQPIPLPDREYFPKNPKSCGSALSKSSGFSRSSSSKSSGRRREIDLEANEEKESLHSQETSLKGADSLMKTINVCLRYVALIPCYEVTDTHIVTLMGLELLKVLHGSPLDHAILLSSYFLYLGIKSWVAIGLGLPRGRSSYVLIQYDLTACKFVLTSDDLFRSRGFLTRSEGYLWYVCDAVTGDRHELRDVGCPMKTVEYVFDNDNIWVNVQTSQDCENVSFDLSKSSDWQTVFDKDIFVMKQPIVNDPQLYSSPGKIESLRQSLEAKIKTKLQKWRPHMKTIWNRYCSGLLRDALPFWEYWTFNPSESKPGFSHKVKQLMVTYRMYGFPLNIPFVNTKSVIAAVKATAVHLNDDPGVEFGLGVEVFAYPNSVLSVWVYLATITRL